MWEDVLNNENQNINDLECENCLLVCKSYVCLQIHKSKCTNREFKKIKCPRCDVLHLSRSNHNCDPNRVIKCTNCEVKIKACDMADHRCYMKVLPKPKKVDIEKEIQKFYSFDFESQFLPAPNRLVRNINGTMDEIKCDRHEVNFVCVRQCGTNTQWSFDVMSQFIKWLRDNFENHEDEVVFVAHNLKGYDGRLLFDYFVRVIKVIPQNVLWNGSKIMSMTVGSIIFRDSLLHFSTALANLPKIFGLDETKFAKGFFPYKFNIPANQAYEGKIPCIKYFEPDMMIASKRVDFLKWHAERYTEVYNFRHELEKYCISDVQILAESMEVYMRDGMSMNSGLNPLQCTTIASYAFKVYRTFHLPSNTLALLTKEETEFAKRAMHGGRTDVRKMIQFYSKEQVEKKIYAKYQDVQSLYPTVQFYDNLPVGVPKIIIYHDTLMDYSVQDQPTIEEVMEWFGFVECDLELIAYIHHPIVLEKINGKLQANLNVKKNVVLTTPELHTALNTGCYKLLRVIAYHKYRASNMLFRSYLRQYLKVKIECSGIPKHIKNDEDWNTFRDYHKNELDITLNKQDMIKNSGKKQLAKMMLNSLWGKFAEGGNYNQQIEVNNAREMSFFETMWDNCQIDVVLNMNVGDKYLMIYKDTDCNKYKKRRAGRSNIALASFVTAWGALRLWDEMNKLKERVLYHDTDSVIYQHDPDKYNIPEGKYLGEWEDETGGKPIVSFVSTGPKTYAYAYLDKVEPVTTLRFEELIKTNTDYWLSEDSKSLQTLVYNCKCKGFSLNAYNSQQVNFKTLHKLVIGEETYLKTKALKFYWNRIMNEMKSSYEDKYLSFKYDKGHIDFTNYMVYPYGYEKFLSI